MNVAFCLNFNCMLIGFYNLISNTLSMLGKSPKIEDRSSNLTRCTFFILFPLYAVCLTVVEFNNELCIAMRNINKMKKLVKKK